MEQRNSNSNRDFSDGLRAAKFVKRLITLHGSKGAQDIVRGLGMKLNYNEFQFQSSYRLKGDFGEVKMMRDHNMWFCFKEGDEVPTKLR